MSNAQGPVLIELEDSAEIRPSDAPLVPDLGDDTGIDGRGMATLAALTARRPSALWRLFWGALLGLVMAVVSVAAWDFVFGLIARNLWLGRAVLAALVVFVLAGLGLALREWIAFQRLKRVDGLRAAVRRVLEMPDLAAARAVRGRLMRLYQGRPEMRWTLENLISQTDDMLDGDALLEVSERVLMQPLDAAARREVEASARQVATITAIVPLALADVVTALVANLRMVRRIAEIYGGRAGLFGSWRLLKTVMLHLVATGAVSVGDDMIQSVVGGGLVGKLSRRFGEGVVNGALTARVGVAAMEVCRPMPFGALKRPRVGGLVKGALAGVFSTT